MSELPKPYERFNQQFPDVAKSYQELGRATHVRGPLDPCVRQLVKLGMAIAARSEGSVHSHVRRALEVGVTPDEIYHVLLMAITSVGFPATVAAYTWINDVLDAEGRGG
jgi:4-carboxymuconolactone decarboxylase